DPRQRKAMGELGAVSGDREVRGARRDGTRLRTDVFRPATGGPHPVLVQRYPYSTRDGFMAMFGAQIAKQNYAVVVQSCRGRFGSEGDFYPFHPDVDDSYDTVEWAAAQPWSDGKVGMYGVSYSGMTQWTAALARPPHLVGCSTGGRCGTSRSCASSRRGSATGATTTTPSIPTGGRSALPTMPPRSSCRSCTSPLGTTTSPRAASTRTTR